MPESLSEKLAAIEAAKAERKKSGADEKTVEASEKKKNEEGEKTAEAQEAALAENELRDWATAFEQKINSGTGEADDVIKRTEALLADAGTMTPEEIAEIKEIKKEAEGTISEIKSAKAELENVKTEIARLNESEFVARIRTEMPTLDKVTNEIRTQEEHYRLKQKSSDPDFVKRLLEYARSAEMGTASPNGGVVFTDAELGVLAKHFEDDIRMSADDKKYQEFHIASEYLAKAEKFSFTTEVKVDELSPQEQEQARTLIAESYLDAFAHFLKNGANDNLLVKKLSDAPTGFLESAVSILEKLKTPDLRQHLSSKLKQVISDAKAMVHPVMERSYYTKTSYDELLKRVEGSR